MLASYFFLLPLRDEAGVALGSTALPVLFAASLVLTMAVAPSASALLQRTPDKGAALHLLYRAMALSIIGEAAYRRGGGGEEGGGLNDSRNVPLWSD